MNGFYSYRLTYEKTGVARYIGHLDLQNLFHRAMRRAGLKSRYSEGFNPHPIISFACPLSVGMDGLGEMADIDLSEYVSADEFVKMLNPALPDGLKARFCQELAQGAKKSAALVRKAAYEIRVLSEDGTEPCIESAVNEFIKKESDIKQLVYELSAQGNIVETIIACGGFGNLKPSVLAETLCGIAGVSLCKFTTRYTRRELIF